MELRHLRYFLAVADERHFGRAARRLGIVQPALSIQIKALEDELGTSLFRRTSRQVDLTNAGELFREEARLTLEQAERARQIVREVRHGQVGTVRIGFVGNAFFAGILSADIREFRAHHPRVDIALQEMLAREQAAALLSGEIDVGYAPKFGDVRDPDITAQLIGSWPWMVAMGSDHALAAHKALQPKALRDETFILYAAPTEPAGHLVAVEQILGFVPTSVLRVGNTVTVLALAAAGIGLALVPSSLEGVIAKDVAYRPLDGSPHRSQAVLLSRRSEDSMAVSTFVATANQRAQGRLL